MSSIKATDLPGFRWEEGLAVRHPKFTSPWRLTKNEAQRLNDGDYWDGVAPTIVPHIPWNGDALFRQLRDWVESLGADAEDWHPSFVQVHTITLGGGHKEGDYKILDAYGETRERDKHLATAVVNYWQRVAECVGIAEEVG